MKNNLIYSVLCLLILGQTPTHAQQRWREMRENGANFYDIKATFLEENKSLLKTYYQNIGSNNNEPNTEGFQAEHEKEEYQDLIHYFRWADWIEPRVADTKGDINAYQEAEYRAQVMQKRATDATLSTRTAANWTIFGPITIGTMSGNGRVNSIKVDPANSSIFYACTPAGQLWKSTDAGGNWSVISTGIPAAGVTDIAIDPTNSNILYALTGDADRAIYHPNSLGLYKSTNGGATWAASGLIYTPSAGVLLTSILIHPTTPSIIIVSGTNGVWRSTNSGASFSSVNSTSIRELVFNPSNPSIVFAASKSTAVLLRSTDAGATWTQITNGLPTSAAAKRFSIDVSKADPNYVYLMSTNTTDNLDGFYRSTDGGLNFTQMVATSPNIPNGQGWYNLAVVADPTNANTVYAAGLQVHKSTNGGATFTNIGIPHVDVHDLTINGTDLLAASDGGVYKYSATGVWSNLSSNLAIAQPYAINLSPTNNTMVVSGHQDNGTNLTTNGTTWKAISGSDGMVCFIDKTDNNRIFASAQNGALRRSTNGGTSVSAIYSVPNGYWVTPFVQDPSVSTTLYTGGYEIYKSTDGGLNWAAISSFGTAAAKQFRWIDVCRTNSQIIYAITTNQIYKTTDGGLNWTEVTGSTGGAYLHIHIDVNNPNAVYLSRATTGGSSVYYTNNGGTTWTSISAGLPNISANTVVTQIGSAGLAYCGTDLGVYYLNPSVSTSWQPYNTGLPSVPVRDLEIQYATSKIFAGTFGSGIWSSPLDQIVIPVELMRFKGTPNTEGVALTWETAQEIRFHHFDVERSADTKTWLPLKEVAAKGLAHIYAILDDKPLTGVNYYRLKMVDNDGTFMYSKTVAVEWGKAVAANWALFPNPVKDKLYLSGNEAIAGEQSLQIVDIAGKTILNTTVQQLRNGLTINQLANGTYFLEFSLNQVKERLSFIVNR